MVRFRDTDPRPREESDEEREARYARNRVKMEEWIAAHPTRPPNPPGYAVLVVRANRRAAELYPIEVALRDAHLYAQRAAFVAGYVDAALTGEQLDPS